MLPAPRDQAAQAANHPPTLPQSQQQAAILKKGFSFGKVSPASPSSPNWPAEASPRVTRSLHAPCAPLVCNISSKHAYYEPPNICQLATCRPKGRNARLDSPLTGERALAPLPVGAPARQRVACAPASPCDRARAHLGPRACLPGPLPAGFTKGGRGRAGESNILVDGMSSVSVEL